MNDVKSHRYVKNMKNKKDIWGADVEAFVED